MIDGPRYRFSPYKGGEPEDYSTFAYSAFEPDPKGGFVMPNYMGYSDYSGSLVEKSNVRSFTETFGELQGKEWWLLHGGHGTEAIVVRRDADEREPEIGEFIDGLENYPLADESLHSEMEMEAHDEAWKSFGRSDFRTALMDEDRAPEGTSFNEWEEFIIALPDDVIDRVWWECLKHGNGDEVQNEGVNDVIFRFDQALSHITPHEVIDDELKKRLPKTSRELLNAVLPQLTDAIATWPDETIMHLARAGQEDELLLEPNPPTDAYLFQRLIDHLLENGGEWTPTAQRLLHTAYYA